MQELVPLLSIFSVPIEGILSFTIFYSPDPPCASIVYIPT